MNYFAKLYANIIEMILTNNSVRVFAPFDTKGFAQGFQFIVKTIQQCFKNTLNKKKHFGLICADFWLGYLTDVKKEYSEFWRKQRFPFRV
ncbi:MAG: hypothetical protein PWQ54_2125 [Bacteroidales bacterium]|nr:hypothetical protein [Bacteroidales bacterium]